MDISNPEPNPITEETANFDWRASLMLVWVAWFSLLYGRMLLETRGQAILARWQHPGATVPISQEAPIPALSEQSGN